MRTSLSSKYATRVLALATLMSAAHADDTPANRGNDPFLHVSSAIVSCPAPRGPFETGNEWIDEAHYRIERGNSCWLAGRCRLPNSYAYDKEIAESVARRLNALNASLQWREKTSLWLTLQRRFVYIDGCVSPDFDTARFVSELGETADVEKVIDRTTVLSPKLKARP
ncbi:MULTISPECIES: BON domain-containing protein [unclassified Caballeronia]|uniref:BON domain-containing protein n=1 Tax=unclassified Caballeronia TaxID=2646786 RepID=UPI002856D01A|nr:MULTISPECIES: BON domain-containing protein [unclassified Caballeronia]MDR5739766.1 BON domain-containing protein [Caballeronia sp. LZ016]MDR5808231.1 BON domain-containing protein [Caballeronia sp. LZ019]